jgi:hypothetical protein
MGTPRPRWQIEYDFTFSDHVRFVKSAQERRDQLETYGVAFEPNVFDPEPLR